MKTVLLLFLLTAGAGRAATLIDWFTLDAAGAAQDSANYTINSTAGQSDVGAPASSSANYRITTGFWALEELGPATTRPELLIVLSGLNVVISWPSPSTGYVLQQTDSLDVTPAPWANNGAIVNDNGLIKSVTIAHNVAKRFYRLQRP